MLVVSPAIRNLDNALREAMANRPATQGFPHLAKMLRRAGVRINTWWLPAMQSCYETDLGPVIVQETPLLHGMADVPSFDRAALVEALRADQAGQTTFPQFAEAAWRAGVVRWVVALDDRTCTYFGLDGQTYVEEYAAVEQLLLHERDVDHRDLLRADDRGRCSRDLRAYLHRWIGPALAPRAH